MTNYEVSVKYTCFVSFVNLLKMRDFKIVTVEKRFLFRGSELARLETACELELWKSEVCYLDVKDKVRQDNRGAVCDEVRIINTEINVKDVSF